MAEAEVYSHTELSASSGWRSYRRSLKALQQHALAAATRDEPTTSAPSKAHDEMLRLRFELNRAKAELRTFDSRLEQASGQLALVQAANARVSAAIEKKNRNAERKKYSRNKSLAEAKLEEIGLTETRAAGRGPRYNALIEEAKRARIEIELLNDDARLLLREREKIRESLSRTQLKHDRISVEREAASAIVDGIRERLENAVRLASGQDAFPAKVRQLSADLDRAQSDFLDRPGQEALQNLGQSCGDLKAALLSADTEPQGNLQELNCDVSDVVAPLKAFQSFTTRFAAYHEMCGDPGSLAGVAPDMAVQKGQLCISEANLQPEKAVALGARLQEADMRRDDVAHRFIISWNAVTDGNPLAYLAFVLAVSIDGLVFASGIGGSRALERSISRSRSAENDAELQYQSAYARCCQLDHLFQPDPSRVARALVGGLRHDDKKSDQTILDVSKAIASESEELEKIAEAASALRLAKRRGSSAIFEVQQEFVDYIFDIVSDNIGNHTGSNREALELMRVAGALKARTHIFKILELVRPAPEDSGFVHQITLARSDDSVSDLRRILNAAVACKVAAWSPGRQDRYLVSNSFYDLLIGCENATDDDLLIEGCSRRVFARSEHLTPAVPGPDILEEDRDTAHHAGAWGGSGCDREPTTSGANFNPESGNAAAGHELAAPGFVAVRKAAGKPTTPYTIAKFEPVRETQNFRSRPEQRSRDTLHQHMPDTRQPDGPVLVPANRNEHALSAVAADLLQLRTEFPKLDGALNRSNVGTQDICASQTATEHALSLTLDWIDRQIAENELIDEFGLGNTPKASCLDRLVPFLERVTTLAGHAYEERASEMLLRARFSLAGFHSSASDAAFFE